LGGASQKYSIAPENLPHGLKSFPDDPKSFPSGLESFAAAVQRSALARGLGLILSRLLRKLRD
jgi:hypothetical protein